MGILEFLRSLFKRRRERKLAEIEKAHQETIRPFERLEVPQKPRKAIYQDYGRFFKGKGKHQHKWYRRSVKAKKQPE